MSIPDMKNMTNNTLYIMPELLTFPRPFKVALETFSFSLISLLNSSTILSVSFFLRLEFSKSKCVSTSHDSSH